MTADEAIINEFRCYYLGDEIAPYSPEFRAEILPILASDSADRMVQDVPREALVSRLTAIRDDRKDRMHEIIAAKTAIGWTEDDALWLVFVDLVDAMIAALQ